MIQARNVDLSTLINNPKFIQTGAKAVWAYHSNSAGGQETVTFSTAFDNTPAVLVTSNVFSVFGIVANTSEITKTGFKISARHTHDSGDPVSTSCRWVAIHLAKLAIKKSS